MKTALLTLNIGNFLDDNSRQSFQDAARRWGCDYLEITEADTQPVHAMKLKAFELSDADRIFYIDADAVISAGCPSPFKTFPERAFVAVRNQQDHMDKPCLDACADIIARDIRTIKQERNDDDGNYYLEQFFNSGMWLASRKYHVEMLKLALEVSIQMYGKTDWRDQSAVNYAALKSGTPVLLAPDRWNYQFPPDTKSGPMKQFVYHWAGGEKRDQIPGINWRSFEACPRAMIISKPKLLWVGDATCDTGFARVTHNVLKELAADWSVYVVGVNYAGDPHFYPYPIWPAQNGGDMWGIGECVKVMKTVGPDMVVVLNDPWIVARFATEIKRSAIPMAAYIPIDARNQHPGICQRLNNLDLAIFYTRFGERECRIAGYKGPSAVIPHGVDTSIYSPKDKTESRKMLSLYDVKGNEVDIASNGMFIIGNVNRNQPRKRLDLTIQCFAEWIRRVAGSQNDRIDDAYLYLHCARRDSAGLDLEELAFYYGVVQRVILPDESVVNPAKGIPETEMAYVYSCFDVQLTTTAGEGFGLCQIEGAACGVPQIAPNFSALGEWMPGAAYMVPVSDEGQAHPVINTVGKVPQKEACIRALDLFYHRPDLREKYGAKALARATEPQYNWNAIADMFHKSLVETMLSKREKINASVQA